MSTVLKSTSAACRPFGAQRESCTAPIPLDLRVIISEEALVSRVLETTAALNESGSGLPQEFPNPEGLSPNTLLSFVTYAYAIGCRDSEEIEETARTDRALAYLSAGQLPSSPTIRRFRRYFRGPITAALAILLRATAKHFTPSLNEAACLAEAQQRLEAAVLADTIALDR